jgi:hypothetical protein
LKALEDFELAIILEHRNSEFYFNRGNVRFAMLQVMTKSPQAAKNKNLSRALTESRPTFLAIGSAGLFKPDDEEEHSALIQVNFPSLLLSFLFCCH